MAAVSSTASRRNRRRMSRVILIVTPSYVRHEHVLAGTDAGRIRHTKGPSIQIGQVELLTRLVEQEQLTPDRLLTVGRGYAQQVLERRPQPSGHLGRAHTDLAKLVEGEGHVAIPRHRGQDQAHGAVLVAVAPGRKRPSHQLTKQVVE